MNAKIEAYQKVIDLINRQIVDIEKSGWSDKAKECAVLNMRGVADVCRAWIECEQQPFVSSVPPLDMVLLRSGDATE